MYPEPIVPGHGVDWRVCDGSAKLRYITITSNWYSRRSRSQPAARAHASRSGRATRASRRHMRPELGIEGVAGFGVVRRAWPSWCGPTERRRCSWLAADILLADLHWRVLAEFPNDWSGAIEDQCRGPGSRPSAQLAVLCSYKLAAVASLASY